MMNTVTFPKRKIYSQYGWVLVLPAILCLMWPAITFCAGPSNYNNPVDPMMNSAKQKYQFINWPSNNTRYDGVQLSDLRFTSYRGEKIDFSPELPVIQRFLGEDGNPLFLIELSICESPGEAREKLVEYITFVSSAKLLPTIASVDIDAGDIGFFGPAPAHRIAWIAFVRGNITIRIVCYDPKSNPYPDMHRIAEKTDRIVRNQPTINRNSILTKPIISQFSAQNQCKAGDSVPLVLQVNDPAGQPADFHWIIGGPGQGYVEKDKNGTWRLFTTKAGNIRLTCHVLGSNGVATSKTLSISVE